MLTALLTSYTLIQCACEYDCRCSIRALSGHGSSSPPGTADQVSHSADSKDQDATDREQQQQRGGTQAVPRLVGGVAEAEHAVRELVEVSTSQSRRQHYPVACFDRCWSPFF